MATIDINLGLTAIAAGTVDVITATYDPAPTLFDRLTLYFVASGANTSTTPTFNPNALGAKTIVKKNNQALVAGDIPGQYYVAHVQYNSTLEKWILLNPASDESDTIWEENAGVVTLQTLANILRLGGDTNWGASIFEIYSEEGLIPVFVGNGSGNFFLIQQNADTFQLVSTIPFLIDSLRVAAVAGAGTSLVQTDNNGELFDSNALPSAATATTQSAGDNSTKVATTAYVKTAVDKQAEVIAISCSDLTTNLATGTTKGYLRMPFAMTLTAVRASVIDAPTGSTLIVDINEAGSTILSTKLTIDASEKTSTTAATPAVISDTALADDAEITVDIDQVGSTNTGKGLIVYLIGTRT